MVSYFKDESEKSLVPTSYNLIIKLSKNEKLQKYRITLPQQTDYVHYSFVHLNFDIFSGRFFSMCIPSHLVR